MKILVLGGTKYFGKRLVDLLTEQGHEVAVASTGKTFVSFKHTVERIGIDRRNMESMCKALGNRIWDVVYDQICFDEPSAINAIEIFSGKIGRLIFTSSQSVYDYGSSIQEPYFVPGSYIANPKNENSYQEGKRLAERAYAKQNLFPITAVRFPIVLGYDDPTTRLHWHVARIKYGDPIYFPNYEARLSLITSEEAAAFLAWIKEIDLAGSVNVGSFQPVKLSNLMSMIEGMNGKKMVIAHESTTENHSPFGIANDWWMNVQKAVTAGFHFKNANKWVIDMVERLTTIVTETNRQRSRSGT